MPWDNSNPLYRWKLKHGKLKGQRKSYKSKRVHMSPVRHMVRRFRYSRPRRRFSYGRPYRHRKAGFINTRSIFKYARVGALLAPAAFDIIKEPNQNGIGNMIYHYTGYNVNDGSWQWQGLLTGWTPFIATTAITAGVQKATAMIKRL